MTHSELPALHPGHGCCGVRSSPMSSFQSPPMAVGHSIWITPIAGNSSSSVSLAMSSAMGTFLKSERLTDSQSAATGDPECGVADLAHFSHTNRSETNRLWLSINLGAFVRTSHKPVYRDYPGA